MVLSNQSLIVSPCREAVQTLRDLWVQLEVACKQVINPIQKRSSFKAVLSKSMMQQGSTTTGEDDSFDKSAADVVWLPPELQLASPCRPNSLNLEMEDMLLHDPKGSIIVEFTNESDVKRLLLNSPPNGV